MQSPDAGARPLGRLLKEHAVHGCPVTDVPMALSPDSPELGANRLPHDHVNKMPMPPGKN
jgi:hypothetical protein